MACEKTLCNNTFDLSKLLYKIYLTYRQTKRNDKSSLLELKTMSKNIGLKNKMRFVYKDSQKKPETFMFQHNQNWLLSSELEGKIYCYTPFWKWTIMQQDAYMSFINKEHGYAVL